MDLLQASLGPSATFSSMGNEEECHHFDVLAVSVSLRLCLTCCGPRRRLRPERVDAACHEVRSGLPVFGTAVPL